ncbi:FAD-binding oxidoreductase [Stigmatella erecta]|uniref:FAD/FMN-containing dehydrogenase n=1 Tax=Stigmatella erecta TaxID=83460 RepID=A0A1I0JFH3_9BACT|nr:FAD-binding oxidoreductase [Stigmatella erecta]SEU08633.1 FAD/FMN-containing dehydrogenase [Stigmatella erecta]
MPHGWDWSCLTGKVVLRTGPSYNLDRTNYNTRHTRSPAALVFCQNTEDVQNAIRCVNKNGIPFRVRSGRHSYEELSLMDDGLIIDVSGLTSAIIDPSTATARVGAGLPQQTLWKLLGADNTYAFPLGTMGGVGIAGVLQGGGIGMLTRAFGLAIDRVLSIQMVTATGDVVEANATTHADLFWALRGGGGGNFGIVTAFTLQLAPVSQVVVYALSWSPEQFPQVMNSWQHWAPCLGDPRLTCQLTFSSDHSLHSEGVYLGTPERLRELLQPWIDMCPPAQPVRIEPLSWYMSTVYFNSFDDPCVHPFKTSGAFIYRPLPSQALASIQQAITSAPAGVSCDIWMQSFGGAMAEVAPTATAFYHRQAQFILEFGGSWMDKSPPSTCQSAAQWTRDLQQSLRAYTEGTYVNFADLNLGSRSTGNFDYLRLYYGQNVARLRDVKSAWDPANLFQFEQSIPPKDAPPLETESRP